MTKGNMHVWYIHISNDLRASIKCLMPEMFAHYVTIDVSVSLIIWLLEAQYIVKSSLLYLFEDQSLFWCPILVGPSHNGSSDSLRCAQKEN